MQIKNKSIFNLIEIFRGRAKRVINKVIPKTHCEQRHIHDFYCSTEQNNLEAKVIRIKSE
jgi:hypothetical protein